MPETILIVEDEPALRDTLAYDLKKDGFIVEAVGDGRFERHIWLSLSVALKEMREGIALTNHNIPTVA